MKECGLPHITVAKYTNRGNAVTVTRQIFVLRDGGRVYPNELVSHVKFDLLYSGLLLAHVTSTPVVGTLFRVFG